MKNKLIILQANEVNFELVKGYISLGYLKNFKYFLENFSLLETKSEDKYENLEPWIQWVSFYSGKKFKDHKVFYLNEFNEKEWNFFRELDDKYKKKLALLFPMNLKNSFSSDTFFLPDPWTDTKTNADNLSNKLFIIVKKIILENAINKINFFDYLILILFSIFKTSLNFKLFLIKNIFNILRHKFFKAIVFDRLCWEIYKNNKQVQNSDISSLFLNACAHIQHHYFLNSSICESTKKNPIWYMRNIDPVLECLKSYDNILKDIRNDKNLDFLILTGLSQSAIQEPIFYYNFKKPEAFFKVLNINYSRIIKRMSRDYTLVFENNINLSDTKQKLLDIKLNSKDFFKITEKENKLYIELIYDQEILNNDYLTNKDDLKIQIFKYVNFLAIKNSIHNEKGYLISSIKEYDKKIDICDVYKIILNRFGN